MAYGVKGDPAKDEDFLRRLKSLEAEYHRNLSIDTYNRAVDFLDEQCTLGPVMKGRKAAWTKEIQKRLECTLSKAQEICDFMAESFVEDRKA
jgi:hypothetical protein